MIAARQIALAISAALLLSLNVPAEAKNTKPTPKERCKSSKVKTSCQNFEATMDVVKGRTTQPGRDSTRTGSAPGTAGRAR